MDNPTLPLPGLSPVSGKRLDVRFDGGMLSSDGGILLLREVEQRLRVADRLAACIKDPRSPEHITHSLADIIGFRLMMIAAGYEDANDAASLRADPMFKMALDLTPSDRALCSQPTNYGDTLLNTQNYRNPSICLAKFTPHQSNTRPGSIGAYVLGVLCLGTAALPRYGVAR